jgi:hypothetical protein
MIEKGKFILLAICFGSQICLGQVDQKPTPYSFNVESINSEKVDSLLTSKMQESQFILIGEQHGIKEVTDITQHVYELASDYGYRTLCIETDDVAAKIILKIASSSAPLVEAQKTFDKFPYAIPFYGNEEDYTLFEKVMSKDGQLWGIDQSFMVQFRLNLSYLLEASENDEFKNALKPYIEDADDSYAEAISTKNYMAPFIFKYSDEVHQELLTLADQQEEIDILEKLKLTKEIYEYNFSKQYYMNNYVRSQHMKENFMTYYNEARTIQDLPKVVFKLGSYHVARGLTETNIYDIGNMASELANTNGKRSIHILVTGDKGMMSLGNPFAPVKEAPFDNTADFPEEVQKLINSDSKGMTVIDLEALRRNHNEFSAELQKWIFRYDIVIIPHDAQALTGFE